MWSRKHSHSELEQKLFCNCLVPLSTGTVLRKLCIGLRHCLPEVEHCLAVVLLWTKMSSMVVLRKEKFCCLRTGSLFAAWNHTYWTLLQYTFFLMYVLCYRNLFYRFRNLALTNSIVMCFCFFPICYSLPVVVTIQLWTRTWTINNHTNINYLQKQRYIIGIHWVKKDIK